jgi:hypothetical protein
MSAASAPVTMAEPGIRGRVGEHERDVNEALAANLREFADLLAQQEADGFRTMAYRRTSDTLAGLDRPVTRVFAAEGRQGLMALPDIGASIASAIAEMLATGRWSRLERLRGTLNPEKLFPTIPGIGPELAARIHERLHVDTLEGLEIAAHDGRLEQVPGIGKRRAELIRSLLAERLGRPRLRRLKLEAARPEVDLLLDVDREYRRRVLAGKLTLIAPKRFNAKGEAWLPVLHTRRDQWELTALFSNTRLAHELGRTRDWMVIYHQAGNSPEGQCAVVTEVRGPLAGRRVVRGRESECQVHYAHVRKALEGR